MADQKRAVKTQGLLNVSTKFEKFKCPGAGGEGMLRFIGALCLRRTCELDCDSVFLVLTLSN